MQQHGEFLLCALFLYTLGWAFSRGLRIFHLVQFSTAYVRCLFRASNKLMGLALIDALYHLVLIARHHLATELIEVLSRGIALIKVVFLPSSRLDPLLFLRSALLERATFLGFFAARVHAASQILVDLVEVEREVLGGRGVEGFDPGLPPLRVWRLLLLLLMPALG